MAPFTPFTRSIALDPRCHFLQDIKAIRPVTALSICHEITFTFHADCGCIA
jgi:hypothetical protein